MIRRPSGRLHRSAAFLACLVALALPGIVAGAAESAAAPATLTFTVSESNATRTIVEVLVPELVTGRVSVGGRSFDVAGIPGAEPYGSVGQPRVAVAGTLIAVAPSGNVDIRVLEASYDTRAGLSLVPVQSEDRAAGDALAFDTEAYRANEFLPRNEVTIGEPAIMRDLRVVPLRVYPIQYNPASGEARILKRLVVEVSCSGSGGENVLAKETPLARSFQPLYESLVANYDSVRGRGYENDSRGRYVIITHDNYYSSILPLAAWKHRRGMEVEIAKLSVIGSSASAIKAYLQNAFNNWPVRPEFILLVGDTEQLPTGSSGTDDYYATLNGSDYLVDAHIGRLSCDDVTQCNLIVAKMLGYEKTPYVTDPNWFRKACLIVRDDNDPVDDPIYYGDTWFAYDLLEADGFTQIDTLFAKHGANQNDVHNAVTNGRVIVNYRGQGVSNWWSPFAVDPTLTSPGYKLPVVVSATCGTGSFSYDDYPCETWMRAGTISAPKGAVGFLATSAVISGHADYRSVVDQGIFDALFNQKIHLLGPALEYGKYKFYQTFGVQGEYQAWNCQGDPEMDVWTRTPMTLAVTHPAAVPPAQSSMLVEVRSGGNPIQEALVCAYAPDQVYASGLTNLQGQVTLSINPATADTVFITVTGHNLAPYQGHAVVTPEGPYLTYASRTVDDSVTGNNDGLVSPGETVRLTVGLTNVGSETASGVTAKLRTQDAHAAPVDSTASYGSVPVGETRTNTDPLSFTVGSDCQNGYELPFTIFASEGARDSWTVQVPAIAVSAADLAHLSTVVNDSGSGDGDGVLEPGETAWVTLTLRNDGPIGLDDVAGVLSTTDPYAVVTDSEGAFGAITGSGGTGQSSANSFRVSVSPGTPPAHQVQFVLAASGDGGTYQHSEDVSFSVTLGGTATAAPSGPDAYGYYAYDKTDTWTGLAPVYSWVELVGTGSLIAAITNEDAKITTLTLPFTFKYYGTNYTQVSVCSNGFMSMGVEDYRMGANIGIPSTSDPDAMIAPLWDDLDPSSSGDIYQWSDTANHRYIIQYDAVVHYGGANPETFEVIWLDPAYYPTASGNGIIIFQYQDPRSVGTATVGIESIDELTGIQYEFNGVYDPAAATITAGQAIKFTTDPPPSAAVWLAVAGLDVDDPAPGGNDDGLAQPSETVNLVITLDNNGTGTASNVSATLTTSDTDVTVVDGTAAFGSIPGGGSGTNAASPFIVTIGPNPDSELVEFDLHIATGARYDTWDVVTLTLDLSETGIQEGDQQLVFALKQNSPNPFGRGTAIAFDLPAPAHARLDIYTATGRSIATVVDRELPAGHHAATWDGRDSSGHEVAAGVYFYRLEAGGRVAVLKMIAVK